MRSPCKRGIRTVLHPLQEALGKKLQLDRLYGPPATSLSSAPCEDRVLDGPASGENLDGPASGILDGPASGAVVRPQTPRAPAALPHTGLFTREGPWDWVASSTEEPIPPPVD